jgi:hypothetical protein
MGGECENLPSAMLLLRRARVLAQTPQGHRLLASGNVAVDKYPRGESHKSTG